MGKTSKGEGLSSWLATLDDAALTRLLSQRRDVLVSPPGSVEQLAGRLSTQHSVGLALSVVDGSSVQVAFVLAQLGGRARAAELEEALGSHLPDGHVAGALQRLAAVGLVWPQESGVWCTTPTLADLAQATGARTFRDVMGSAPVELVRQALELLGLSRKGTKQQLLQRLRAEVESPVRLAAVMATAPPDVLALVGQIADEGSVPRRIDEVSSWLAQRCLLFSTGASRMTVAPEVLRWHSGSEDTGLVVEPPLDPPPGPPCSADAAMLLVARMRAVLGVVGPGLKVLQSGGIGAQEQKRVAKLLGIGPETVAWLLVLAGDAELLTTGSEEGRLTRQGAAWLELDDIEAYLALIGAAVTANIPGWGTLTLPWLGTEPRGSRCPLFVTCSRPRYTLRRTPTSWPGSPGAGLRSPPLSWRQRSQGSNSSACGNAATPRPGSRRC